MSANKPTIIFLMGRQRSGKDTVADYLVTHHGFTKVALADELKELASYLFGMEKKDRGLLISFGTKMREIDPYVWINQMWRTIEFQWEIEGVDRFVIPDVRFPNEYDFLMAQGGIPVTVLSDTQTRSKRPGYDPEFEHDPTEEALIGFTPKYFIPNYGSRSLLRANIKLMLEEMQEDGCLR